MALLEGVSMACARLFDAENDGQQPVAAELARGCGIEFLRSVRAAR